MKKLQASKAGPAVRKFYGEGPLMQRLNAVSPDWPHDIGAHVVVNMKGTSYVAEDIVDAVEGKGSPESVRRSALHQAKWAIPQYPFDEKREEFLAVWNSAAEPEQDEVAAWFFGWGMWDDVKAQLQPNETAWAEQNVPDLVSSES